MLDLTLLESLVHIGLDLLAKCVHLIGLSLDKCCLGGDYLLVAGLHVALTLVLLHLLGLDLNLMSLCVLLLSSQLLLNLLEVQEFSRLLEGQG